MAIYNYPFYIMPIVPNDKFFRPPLLYDLMNSMVNFGQEEKTQIKNLSSVARETIFDFDYPLSANVNKAEFETMILNKFMMRRIGYETFTPWQIQLNVKLNEIMPVYNKLFDALENWNLFNDSESFIKNSTDNRTTTNSNQSSNSTSGTNATNNSLDKRNSKLPQNEIADVQSGTYLTDYEKDAATSQDAYSSQGSSSSSGSGTDADMYHEETTKNMSNINNKLNVYNTFLENRNNIMSLIFKDLDSLFYGITNSN